MDPLEDDFIKRFKAITDEFFSNIEDELVLITPNIKESEINKFQYVMDQLSTTTVDHFEQVLGQIPLNLKVPYIKYVSAILDLMIEFQKKTVAVEPTIPVN